MMSPRARIAALGAFSAEQSIGVGAQVLQAMPAPAASLVVARTANLALVSDLALALSVASTVFAAASLNLSQYLAIWGSSAFPRAAYPLNRLIAVTLATSVSGALLWYLEVNRFIAVFAIAVKLADSAADLAFGLDVAGHGTQLALRRLAQWSTLRLLVLSVITAVGLLVQLGGPLALATGGLAQLVMVMHRRDTFFTAELSAALSEALRLARVTGHYSLATAMCGVLVTAPRLVAPDVVAETQLGTYGIAFVMSTVLGMSYNVVWLRLATRRRLVGQARAWRAFLAEGAGIGVAILLAMALAAPGIRLLYGVTQPDFMRLFLGLMISFVVFYFAMSATNLLKASRFRLLESSAYAVSALALVTVSSWSASVVAGILAAATCLIVFVVFGAHSVETHG